MAARARRRSDEAETLLRMARRAGQGAAGSTRPSALVDEAEDLVRELGSPPMALMCQCARGELARHARRAGAGAPLLSGAVARMGELPAGPPHLHVVMLVGLAHVELDEDDVAGARALADEAAGWAVPPRTCRSWRTSASSSPG